MNVFFLATSAGAIMDCRDAVSNPAWADLGNGYLCCQAQARTANVVQVIAARGLLPFPDLNDNTTAVSSDIVANVPAAAGVNAADTAWSAATKIYQFTKYEALKPTLY